MILLETIDFNYGTEFSFNGSNFFLILTNSTEVARSESDGDAFSSRSTYINGWDLYMYEGLEGEQRMRKLFHEVTECNLIDQGCDGDEAHLLALEIEEEVFGPRPV